MKKRNYLSPSMEIVEMKAHQVLLAGSGEQLENYQNGGNIWEDDDYDN